LKDDVRVESAIRIGEETLQFWKSKLMHSFHTNRMQGMKAKLTSAKTANDPNSRINKSLRAWDCD